MKKFIKMAAVVASMAMVLGFISCGGNEETLNLVGNYSITKIENFSEMTQSGSKSSSKQTVTMPSSLTFRTCGTSIVEYSGVTTTTEMDYTTAKIESDSGNTYEVTFAKYTINGVDAGEEAITQMKTVMESQMNDSSWAMMAEMFESTMTTNADGTWTNNQDPVTSGTYTIDQENSKVLLTTVIEDGVELAEPETEEIDYSDYGKTLVATTDMSGNGVTQTMSVTMTRQ